MSPRRLKRRGDGLSGLTVAALVLAAVFALPLVAVFWVAATGGLQDWPHLSRFVLPHAVGITLWTLGVTLFLAGTFGVATAWFVAMCAFPGRKIFGWALLLPLAVPGYVSAYFWVEFLSFSGPLQSGLRSITGLRSAADYWFPTLNNPWGAGFIYASVLYPYVYLTARILFASQARSALETARSLGAPHGEVFRRIAMPMARPAIVVGLSLVAMETLNDIGAADYLGVDMLALAVFDTWLNRGSLAGAAQISFVLLAFIVVLLVAEYRARKAPVLAARGAKADARHLYQMKGAGASLVFGICLLPLLMGFLIPVGLILIEALQSWHRTPWDSIASATLNSLLVAGLAALLCYLAAILLVGAARQSVHPALRLFMRMASLGYAIPGTILGIGTLIIVTRFDNSLDAILRQTLGVSSGLLLTGSVFGLVFASAARFLAMTHGSMTAELQRVGSSIDQAARSLGQSRWGLFVRVHAPMLARAGLAGALLVFVDTLKELSATLILLPFNFQTLATHLYVQASNGQLEEGTVAALGIVAVGVLPVIYVSKVLFHNGPRVTVPKG